MLNIVISSEGNVSELFEHNFKVYGSLIPFQHLCSQACALTIQYTSRPSLLSGSVALSTCAENEEHSFNIYPIALTSVLSKGLNLPLTGRFGNNLILISSLIDSDFRMERFIGNLSRFFLNLDNLLFCALVNFLL